MYFGPTIELTSTGQLAGIASGDFNHDGRPDLVTGYYASNQGLAVRLGTGPGTFGPEQPIAAAGIMIPRVADFNGDGNDDIVAGSNIPDPETGFYGIYVSLGRGDGTFLAPVLTELQAPADSIAIADFDKDGKLDVVVSAYVGDNQWWTFFILAGNGDGTFGYRASAGAGYWYGASPLYLADVDGDGWLDVVASMPNGIYVYPSDGAGGLRPGFARSSNSSDIVAVYDVYGDGRQRMVFVDRNDSGRISIASVSGSTISVAPTSLTVGYVWSAGVTADFDGDGRTDIALVRNEYEGPTVELLFGTGGQAAPFRLALAQGTGGYGEAIARDLDGDGDVDLAFAVAYYGGTSQSTGAVLVAPNAKIGGGPLGIAGPQAICPGQTGTASAPDFGPGTSWAWSTNGYIVDPTQRVVQFSNAWSESGPQPTNLSVVVTPPGCAPLSGSRVVPNDPPTFGELTVPDSLCHDTPGVVASVPDMGPGTTYEWSTYNVTVTSGLGTNAITFTAGPDNGGIMNVYCYVTLPSGCTWGYSRQIFNSPYAHYTYPGSICSGGTGTVSADDQGPGAVYTWTLQDGSILDGQGTSTIHYTSTHVPYTAITLAVETPGGCTSRVSGILPIAAPPSGTMTGPAAACPGSTGNVASVANAGSGARYHWTINNGTFTSVSLFSNSVTFTAGAVGTTGISVWIEGSVDQGSCIGSGYINIPIVPSATLTAPASVCANGSGAASVPNAGTGATYSWSITNGAITSGAGTRSISFTAGASGSVGLSIAMQAASGCTASGATSVTVNALPSAVITTAGHACAGSNGNGASVPSAGAGATYAWTIANGTIASGQGTRAVVFSVTAGSGPATLGVTVTNGTGCAASSWAQVSIDPLPAAGITAPASVCGGSTGNAASVADGGAGAVYTWTISNGTITGGTGTRNITFTAAASGQVALGVTVRSSAGCAASATRNVTINATPSATITAPASVKKNAKGISASVPDAGVGATYTWTITRGTITAGAGTRSLTFTAGNTGPVTLGVTVRSAAGCASSGSRDVTVN